MKRFLLIILVLMAACSPRYRTYTPDSPQIPKIEWKKYNRDLFAAASHDKKPVLLYFESDSCSACSKMNNETLSDPIVIHTVNDHFVPIRISEQNDKNTFSELTGKYKIEGIPHFSVVTYPGYDKPVLTHSGYARAGIFILFLNVSKDVSAILDLQTIGDGLIDAIEGK